MLLGAISKKFDTIVEFTAFEDFISLEKKGKKYIIFDMDGTLIDSIGIWNITDQKLIEEYGGRYINLDDIQDDLEI